MTICITDQVVDHVHHAITVVIHFANSRFGILSVIDTPKLIMIERNDAVCFVCNDFAARHRSSVKYFRMIGNMFDIKTIYNFRS